MKRNYRILTVVVAASITFASLMIIAGPQRFTKNMNMCNYSHAGCARTHRISAKPENQALIITPPKTEEARQEEKTVMVQ